MRDAAGPAVKIPGLAERVLTRPTFPGRTVKSFNSGS